LKDRFYQPVIVFTPAGQGCLSGSARSIPGLHIRDLLADIHSQHGDLMLKFGGHAMAAGLTIREGSFECFQDCFLAAVTQHFRDAAPSHEILTDGPLAAEFFTREIATMLRNAAPWGQQFPPPVFDNEFRVVSQRVVGEQHLKLRLRSRDRTLDAIAFRHLEPGQEPQEYDLIRAAFQLDINEYRGESNLQLLIEHLEPLQ
jgi:single-stranded-DNA-specific exonuclease